MSLNDGLVEYVAVNETLGSLNGTTLHDAMDDDPRHHGAPAASLLLFAMLVGAQFGLHYWRTKQPKSYHAVTLVGFWLIPGCISVYLSFYRMLFFWLCFTGVSAYLLYKAQQKPLNVKTPRQVYSWFLWIYRACYFVAVVGYVLWMFEFFGLRLLLSLPDFFPELAVSALFYGLYYGIFGRDLAEQCAERMATSLGFSKRSGGRLPHNICGLCGDELKRLDEDSTAEQEEIMTLPCSHLYHEFCLRGWAIVGKKDTCPYCSEKVEIKSLLKNNPWETRSLTVANLMDSVRYLVVWVPVIILLAQGMFKVFGIQ